MPDRASDRVTAGQAACLQALATFDNRAPWEPNATQIAERAGKPRHWAPNKLCALERMGLARCRMGKPLTWRVTDRGRAHLAQQDTAPAEPEAPQENKQHRQE